MIKKYANHSSYLVFANNPILFTDPDGKDIIVLRNSGGARNTGHGAILVGDNKNGWTYISKDGFVGSACGSQSKFIVQKFSSIEEFRNSPHNFETLETHFTTEGKQASTLTFKLDKDGNKIQRYDKALYFGTTQADQISTDSKTIDAATKTAKAELLRHKTLNDLELTKKMQQLLGVMKMKQLFLGNSFLMVCQKLHVKVGICS